MQDEPVAELDLVGLLWRRKSWLIISVVVGALLGYGLSQLQPVRYAAESRVFLSSSSSFDPLGQRASGEQERYVVQQAALMTSQLVLETVTPPPSVPRESLDEALVVTASGDSDLVTVRATAGTPQEAAGLADDIAAAYTEYTAQSVTSAADRAVAAVTDPEQAEQIRAAAAVYGDGVALVDAAAVPASPSQPAPLRNAILLAVLAGLLCVAVVVLVHTRRSAPGRAREPDAEGAGGKDPVASSPLGSGSSTSERVTSEPATSEPGRLDRLPPVSRRPLPTSAGPGVAPPDGEVAQRFLAAAPRGAPTAQGRAAGPRPSSGD